ncbi:MAG TPA: hypothetical protein VNQ14_11535 [Woeseiaceae bacterium]|nr:hypothetical protein [Woeseiaceae bacterium]
MIDYIVTGSALGAVAALAIAVRVRRDILPQRAFAANHGWTVLRAGTSSLRGDLADVALFQTGHSSQLGPHFRTADGIEVFGYRYETGADRELGLHTWRVAMSPAAHTLRAMVTTQDWLLALADKPAAHREALARGPVASVAGNSRTSIVIDTDCEPRRLPRALTEALSTEPAGRTWELLPGYVVVYEPGAFREKECLALVDSARRIAPFAVAD